MIRRICSQPSALLDCQHRRFGLHEFPTSPLRQRQDMSKAPKRSSKSAGVLAFRATHGSLEVLLIHPGGPFWAKKDAGSWSIPKGLYSDDEEAFVAAKREFEEETGFKPAGDFIDLGAFKQPSGKIILVWAMESDFDISS